MTDDELIALARKATQGEWLCIGPSADAKKPLPLQWQHRYEIRTPDTAPTDKHSWPYRIAQTIEGQSSPQHKNDFEYIAAANPAAIIAMIERHRAEVERLTRERNGANDRAERACNSGLEAVRLGVEYQNRAEAAESALAAAQKRVGEFQTALEEIASNTTSLGDALDTACNALQRKRAAAAAVRANT